MAALEKIKAFTSALPEIRVAEARKVEESEEEPEEVRLNLINIALSDALIGGCCADNIQNAIRVCFTVSVPLHMRLSRLQQVASLTRSGDAFAETRVVLYCAAHASSAVAKSCATLRALK
jgi:hypothetical protein